VMKPDRVKPSLEKEKQQAAALQSQQRASGQSNPLPAKQMPDRRRQRFGCDIRCASLRSRSQTDSLSRKCGKDQKRHHSLDSRNPRHDRSTRGNRSCSRSHSLQRLKQRAPVRLQRRRGSDSRSRCQQSSSHDHHRRLSRSRQSRSQSRRSSRPQRTCQLKPRCASSSKPLLAVADGGSLWGEPLTKVPPGRQIHLPGVLLSDAGLRQWFDVEGPRHLARLGPGPLDCMDLSHNNLSDQGADNAVSFLLWRGQPTKRLKLFHNCLREPQALCRLLEDERCGVGAIDGITELHLSHNQMNMSMLERLLGSLATRLNKEGKPLRPPLWLRMEHNNLDSGAEDLLKETYSGVKLCFECGIKGRRQGCNLARCRYGADVHLVLTMVDSSTGRRR